ncbi:hypothetical protein ACHAXA_009312 [Cyclostephanos tholiformis]|uniref:FAD/NAD(P)-binding domain-containing protein n=1 Tax=Cyclostephanos tholiformis TaxID=382380 RepID=A0ABD3R5L9_9STRA
MSKMRVIVVGRGPVGCKLSQSLSRLGCSVVLICGSARLLPNGEMEASAELKRVFKNEGIDIGVKINPITNGIIVDKKLQTSVKGVYAAGDCTGDRAIAARNILLPLKDTGVLSEVPSTTFTDPEGRRRFVKAPMALDSVMAPSAGELVSELTAIQAAKMPLDKLATLCPVSLDGTAAQHGEERRVASAAQRDPSQQEVVPRMREFDHGGGVRMKTGMEGRWGKSLRGLIQRAVRVRERSNSSASGAFVVRLIEGMVPTVPTACVFPLGGGGNITAANNNNNNMMMIGTNHRTTASSDDDIDDRQRRRQTTYPPVRL